MKLCSKCNKPIERTQHANNVKYCHACRSMAYSYREYRREWQRQKHAQIAKIATGKVQCLVCGLWYKKPLTHVWQARGLNEKQYKEAHGLERKGIVADSTKEKLQEAVQDNYDRVVRQNLLQKGKPTRYKKGDKTLGKYQRSQQTLERLSKQFKRLKTERTPLQNGSRSIMVWFSTN